MDFDSPAGGAALTPSNYYPQEKMCRQPSLQERLKMAVDQAEEKLSAVKRAAEILAKNPELEELLNIMQRSHF
jgi:hypothetical protein